MVEAMRHAFADRNDSLGDPAFVDNPVARLISKDYAAGIRADIDRGVAPRQVTALHEKPETTHYYRAGQAGQCRVGHLYP